MMVQDFIMQRLETPFCMKDRLKSRMRDLERARKRRKKERGGDLEFII